MSELRDNVDQPEREEGERRYVSERGPFEIWENPTINRPSSSENVDVDRAADAFEYTALADEYGEGPARRKIGEMVQAFAPGASTTPLFVQRTPNGMSLIHAWFGPHFPLFRHSHPRYGDCLYYIVAGEIIMGRRRLGPGSGFFLPNGMPYKYTAGPEGVELLEFRAGGGDADAPGMKLEEHSLDSIQRIIDAANAHRDEWQAPERVGDTALLNRTPQGTDV